MTEKESDFYWHPCMKLVLNREDGTVHLGRTKVERERRGLPPAGPPPEPVEPET